VKALELAFDQAPGAETGRALVGVLGEARELETAARLGESPRAALLDGESLERLAELLLAGARPGQALLAAERGYERSAAAGAAWSAALGCQRLGDDSGAERWLRRADEAGLAGPGHLERAPELRALVERPEHAGLRSRLL
jgi:hypothetical protein